MLTELDLRLHLHEPRPTRITKDIHDVRSGTIKHSVGIIGQGIDMHVYPPLPPSLLPLALTAELVVHGERVNRHADAIAEALTELKEAPATVTAKLEEKV